MPDRDFVTPEGRNGTTQPGDTAASDGGSRLSVGSAPGSVPGTTPLTTLTFATVVHEIREKLVELQNAPHEEHAGPVCPICVLTNRMLARLQEQSDA